MRHPGHSGLPPVRPIITFAQQKPDPYLEAQLILEPGTIRIVAIPGSVRPGNYTTRILQLALDELRNDAAITVDYLEPATLDLPVPGRQSESNDPQLGRCPSPTFAMRSMITVRSRILPWRPPCGVQLGIW